MLRCSALATAFAMILTPNFLNAGADATVLTVYPPQISLHGARARQQLVVLSQDSNGRIHDLTRQARVQVVDPSLAVVDASGVLTPRKDGRGKIQVQVGNLAKVVPIEIRGLTNDEPVNFAREVVPILTKSGCNQGACHGGQHGKGGFRLSLLGFDPAFDYSQIVQSAEGRRVVVSDPGRSILLLKPTVQMEHGGGERLKESSPAFAVLRRWLEDGAPEPAVDEPMVTRLEVFPTQRVLEPGEQQQLAVKATWSNGQSEDVSSLVQYDTLNESVASINPTGLVTAKGKGETHIMMRFCGQVAVMQVTLPYTQAAPTLGFRPANFIDDKLVAKWRDLGLTPSPVASDAEFFRRIHLDTLGTLPDPADIRAFLADKNPDKRKKAIDHVLERPEFVDFWTLKWGDLLRINRDQLQEKGMWSFHNWLRASLRDQKPLDEFVRDIITAEGSTFTSGPANYYRTATNPADWAESTSQLFLGVRIQCARCHHHPFEKWSQDDYYGMTAFFARMGTKNSQEFGIFGQETVVHLRPNGETRNPRKGGIVKPRPLDGEPTDDPFDRRRKLAEWITSPDNPYFARNLANRFWGYYMGRGLVEPLDDLRATNPPTNAALLDALATDLVEHHFDLKHLLRTIMNSRAYQLSSSSTPGNAIDVQNVYFARCGVRRLSAEQFADALDFATSSREKYQGLPAGTRAIQLPDTNVRSFLMDVFGRPPRQITCECERKTEPNIAQAMHLLNGDAITRKVASQGGRVDALIKAKTPPAMIVEELYLVTLSRPPHPEEALRAQEWMQKAPTPRDGAQDLLWVLLNSREFLFNH